MSSVYFLLQFEPCPSGLRRAVFPRHAQCILHSQLNSQKSKVRKAPASSYLLVRSGAPPVEVLLGLRLSWWKIKGTMDGGFELRTFSNSYG